METTIRELLAQAETLLRDGGSARLDAELLLGIVLDKDRSYFYSHPETTISATDYADYYSLISKRQSGYPVAYLMGKREFWSMELQVTRHTLIPRPETERLVEAALEYIPPDSVMRILDLGTGSGAIALAIARERPVCKVTAVDVSREALNVARMNAERLQLTNVELRQSDWFTGLSGELFDLIVSNPPYVESDHIGFERETIRFEPRLALDGGHHGLLAIQQIIPAARRHLHEGGYLLLEHGNTQGNDIRNLLALHHYKDIMSLCDYAGLERVTLGRFV